MLIKEILIPLVFLHYMVQIHRSEYTHVNILANHLDHLAQDYPLDTSLFYLLPINKSISLRLIQLSISLSNVHIKLKPTLKLIVDLFSHFSFILQFALFIKINVNLLLLDTKQIISYNLGLQYSLLCNNLYFLNPFLLHWVYFPIQQNSGPKMNDTVPNLIQFILKALGAMVLQNLKN